MPMYHGEQTPSQRVLIREVWADNRTCSPAASGPMAKGRIAPDLRPARLPLRRPAVDEEMAYIREIIDRYPWLAMDTEFPGCVARPIGSFRSRTESNYQNIRCNVDLLNLIQLGITFCDADGILPPGCSTWQFNFKFSLNEDLYAQDSIELLTQAGIDFKKHDVQGISPLYFAELLMVSGVVLNDDVRWISFHSGYDFGYLLKVLTCKPLPTSESDFFELLRTYFPAIYDIKFVASSCDNLKGGLNKLAEQLEVPRIGPEHQAGSDSLLTQATFFKLRQSYFEDYLDDDQYLGVLWGLGTGVSGNAGGGFQFGGSPHPGSMSGHGLGGGHSMGRLPQPEFEAILQ
mmetsp:Transcript_46792/g.107866  ORF Transcript_46792/g.107866 Transcript_46792/m.107866 type:complete len:345 (+) Transcript_46792:89-1123(+)